MSAVPIPSPVELPDPAAALAASTLLPPGATPRLLRAMTGGEVETFVFAAGQEPGPVWLQRIADTAAWEPAVAAVAAVRAAWDPEPCHAVHAAFPHPIAPGTFATLLPRPLELVADPLLRAVFAAAPPPAGLGWLAPVCHRLGRYLGARRQPPLPPRAATATVGLGESAVVATVAHLLAGAPGSPPRTAALARTLHASPRLVRALQDAVRAYRRPATPPVALHGHFGPAAVLHDPAAGTAHLIGWIDAAAGPAEFDAGYFVGELAECAAAARLTGRPALATAMEEAVRAFIVGYTAAHPAPLPPTFAATLADIAALKIVEHVARFTRHFGEAGQSALHLLAIAEALPDPSGWLIDALSTRTAMGATHL